jgi:hypothetical protein
MKPNEVLKHARAAGLRIEVDGDDLILDADAEPPSALLDLLRQHKPQLITMLRRGPDGWTGEDWRAFFDERAAIGEHDGALSKAEAEARAFDCCRAEWMNRHPVHTQAGRCASCGEADLSHDQLVPFGTQMNRVAWLHSRCFPAWYGAQKASAEAELQQLGIFRIGERE